MALTPTANFVWAGITGAFGVANVAVLGIGAVAPLLNAVAVFTCGISAGICLAMGLRGERP